MTITLLVKSSNYITCQIKQFKVLTSNDIKLNYSFEVIRDIRDKLKKCDNYY